MEFELPDYSNIMVGFDGEGAVYNGILYCETCWKTRLDLSPCSCSTEEVVKCSLCIVPQEDPRIPCAVCFPGRFENWEAASAILEEIMAPYKELEEAEEEDDDWDPEDSYGALFCENCFGSYKDVTRQKPPCQLCNPAFRDAWTRARYGGLSCDHCKTVYSADSTFVCSACHPQFIEDCCGPQYEVDEDRYSREYCRRNYI